MKAAVRKTCNKKYSVLRHDFNAQLIIRFDVSFDVC